MFEYAEVNPSKDLAAGIVVAWDSAGVTIWERERYDLIPGFEHILTALLRLIEATTGFVKAAAPKLEEDAELRKPAREMRRIPQDPMTR
eukprot:CAMPEP_0185265758 /NCGR_PEP_ID=MMETSP1359-20130426/28743_1 /TAXON_ID=552665 /ORGANISM="Bigelowiella longifila, Strain CCMP242" /LENGTH=88 /DNA_ID=CAMNT_0027855233 /DNA_START=441 /DNA_END=704 /DNA_ORIENTATION=-